MKAIRACLLKDQIVRDFILRGGLGHLPSMKEHDRIAISALQNARKEMVKTFFAKTNVRGMRQLKGGEK